MNAMMAGMIPVMIILMTRDMRAMEPTSARFWGIMSLASLAGAVLAYPINWWLVKNQLKHGMGTERVLGKGGVNVEIEKARLADISAMGGMKMSGSNVSAASKFVVTFSSQSRCFRAASGWRDVTAIFRCGRANRCKCP